MKRIKKYDGEDGSLVELDMPKRIEFSEDTGSTGSTKPMSFKEAFAKHRDLGDKTFEWQGKKYTTELASPKSSRVAEPALKPTKMAQSELKPAKYETSYDRMNRINREEEAVRKASKANEPALMRSGINMPKRSEFTGMGSMKFAGGGKVSSASKRADGIATKGKTRGTMITMKNGGKC
jgi:hypothetical protein